MNAIRSICTIGLVGSLLLAAGCVSPTYHSRAHVSSHLQSRVGHDLGPLQQPCDIAIPEFANLDDGVSEDEAIAIGLWNNPSYRALLADLGITRADVIQAAQLQNPRIITLFPVGPKQWEFTLNLPVDVLWLRPIRLAAAQLESERVADRLVQDGLNVVRDVRVAWIDWELAQQQAELAEFGATLRREIARVAEARLEAGDIAELNVSITRADASAGEAVLDNSLQTVELSYQQLRYALGLQLSDIKIVASPPTTPSVVLPPVEDLVADALDSRPDLRAIRLSIAAANRRAELARKDIWQPIAILPDINSRGTKGFEAGPGLQLSLPIFHKNEGAVARALAEAEIFRWQCNDLRQRVSLEVRQAYTQLQQAQRQVDLWITDVLPQTEEAAESAQQALQEDAVTLLMVLETTRQLLNAKQQVLVANAQLRRAIAELERSVGRRLVDTASGGNEDGGVSIDGVQFIQDAQEAPLPN